jgi:hypothetical protein
MKGLPMTEAAIADLFQIQSRFLRSAHLERDFEDPRALNGYVLTPEVHDHLERLASGIAANSGRRAWCITGNFGSGKSSFALVTAHLFSERGVKLPPALRQAVNFKQVGVPRPRLLPVLITGAREPISLALLRALHRDLANACGRGRPPSVLERIKAATESSEGPGISDDLVLALIAEANNYVVTSGKATGLLILLDELGKFLEYAALHPDKQDVFLMQRLAETAARSGRTPLFVIGLLHQGFGAYADNLSQSAQREWEKVAGRFDELLFDQPLEQTAGLVGDALNIRLEGLPKAIAKSFRSDMQATLRLGWYGATAVKATLLATAVRLYPLHPTVVPVLVYLFSRFGQNQRSLFSFLLSNEPFGLLDFAQAAVSAGQSYRLHHLYDYARATFGHRLSVQSYRSHWNHIESLIESFPTNDVIELQVLKSVGLLNLIDANNLLATEEAIVLAVAGEVDGSSSNRVRRAIKRLHREKRVLYYRGASGGYCLWPHTSVNLQRAYEDAVRALGALPPHRVSPLIESYLETRPLVARRHYIETGNLRHFEVRFAPVEKLSESVRFSYDAADGRIVIALCETAEEHQEALQFVSSGVLQNLPEVLVAVPSPLGVLGKLVQELQRWEWVGANTPELNNDEYAREEVTCQIANARQTLEKRIQSLIGLQQFVGKTELRWFRQSGDLEIKNNRELLERLSNTCDEVYALAPRVHNELINRRSPSAAANGARTRLLEGMFGASSEPYLGMNPAKKPPEMAIYLSLLEKGRIHRQVGDAFALCEPEEEMDVCNIRPALQRIGEILEEKADGHVRLSDLIAELRRPPYGIRDGLSPILIALFAVMHEQNIAFYDNGAFMREMVGLDIMRLTKVPEVFEIQYCKVAGVRSLLFKRLLSLLEQEAPEVSSRRRSSPSGANASVLDIVRTLCVFAAQLPSYTHRTKRLSVTSLAVRSALLSAREPSLLLFRDLPVACGFPAITSDSRSEIVEAFVDTLRNAIADLRQAYSLLHERMQTALSDFFGVTGSFAAVRESLSRRAINIVPFVTEPHLKAFCLRIADLALTDAKWLDSLGSLVCSVTPQKWTDLDAERFFLEINLLVGRFKRVEGIAFEHSGKTDTQLAVRVAVTHLDGTEMDTVIFTTEEEEAEIAAVEAKIGKLLNQTKQVGLAGAARALWTILQDAAISREGQ